VTLFFLWTDILVWTLVAVAVVGGWMLLRSLDSVHFKVDKPEKGTPVVSLLDMAMAHQKDFSERTYSAPFAIHEYTKSIVVDAQGKSTQRYLPLKYVQGGQMLSASLKGLFTGMLISVFLIGLHLLWRSKGDLGARFNGVFRGETQLPWRTAYGVFMLMTVLLAWLYVMNRGAHWYTDNAGDAAACNFSWCQCRVLQGVGG